MNQLNMSDLDLILAVIGLLDMHAPHVVGEVVGCSRVHEPRTIFVVSGSGVARPLIIGLVHLIEAGAVVEGVMPPNITYLALWAEATVAAITVSATTIAAIAAAVAVTAATIATVVAVTTATIATAVAVTATIAVATVSLVATTMVVVVVAALLSSVWTPSLAAVVGVVVRAPPLRSWSPRRATVLAEEVKSTA
jgi:hypothetical protein